MAQHQQQQQAPGEMVERCLALLTDIVNRQIQQPSIRSRIEKEIKYLPTFEGRPGTLPAFLTSVDRALAEQGNQAQLVYAVIYNEKILGPAKNYLETAPPATWDECKRKLKLQYKPSKDQGRIMHEISMLRVSSIHDLVDKIRNIVEDISECAIFSDHQSEIVNHLSSVLVLKIKEITAGALAAELYNQFRLEEIRAIINKYIGHDHYNLKFHKSNQAVKDNYSHRPNLPKPNVPSQIQNSRQNDNNSGRTRHGNFNNSSQFRYNNSFANSGQFRRNFSNNNALFRNSPNNNNIGNLPQPMEVDQINI